MTFQVSLASFHSPLGCAAEPSAIGTTYILDESGRSNLPIDKTLKRHGDIILVPQPSDDPNDPLVCSSYRTSKSSFIRHT